MGPSHDEFPLLSALGLYAADIRGDGNCLFNALSDQIYGTQDRHHDVRTRVIKYMRDHADYYKQFIDVHPGGGLRRNPKRKNAGSYSSYINAASPTPDEVDKVFEDHVQRMARGGTYGDNMEITAFSSAFEVDVKIYQRDFAYMVTNGDVDCPKNTAHIAYHSWEHYSSIRNLEGPHQGLPHVRARALSPDEERQQKEKLERTPHVLPWMIEMVSKSLPFLADKIVIKKVLEDCKGGVNEAVSRLLDAEERGSASSAQESSSVEQEADSDEDGVQGPNKRRDQRLSKATRALLSGQQPDSTHRRLLALSIAEHATRESKSFISISETTVAPSSSPLHPSSPPQSSSIPCTPSIKAELFNDTDDPETGIEQSDTDDSDWIPEPSRPSSRASVSSPTRSGGIRLKLYPRPVDASPSIGIVACRTMQKQLGPQHHRLTSRDRKDMKKAAQKIARKQRAQAEAAAKSKQVDIIKNSTSALPILSNGRVMQSPFIESGIKTLYI